MPPTSGVPTERMARLSLASKSVHADDWIQAHRAVAPAMHVSTTFRYDDDPDKLIHMRDESKPETWNNPDPAAPLDSHVYSRDTNPNSTRLEAVLSAILGGPCLTYSSGLAAWHSMFVRINPRRVAIGDGYHGVHGIISVMERLTGVKKLPLDCDASELGPGDIIHVETPLNPTGEARNLAHYAAKARAVGAYLTVDATFAPPPLQDPFALGADFVMHSGTKYFGGHSDMLCGVLAVRPGIADKHMADLKAERLVLGNVMGSFEGWLGIRSLRTLELRVTRQSETATALVSWLVSQLGDESTPSGRTVERVLHASLQEAAGSPGFAAGTRGEKKENGVAKEGGVDDSSGGGSGGEYWLRKQMPRGFGPVFAIVMKEEQMAKRLPSRLKIFQHATSLGGVESLIEWRAMSDPYVDQRLLRVSIGVEGLEDLKEDFEQAFKELVD